MKDFGDGMMDAEDQEEEKQEGGERKDKEGRDVERWRKRKQIERERDEGRERGMKR